MLDLYTPKIRDLALEAGFVQEDDDIFIGGIEHVEKLLQLERNRTWTREHWTEYEKNIAAAEREACAKVCENGMFLHDFSPEAVYSRAYARAIRARGQA